MRLEKKTIGRFLTCGLAMLAGLAAAGCCPLCKSSASLVEGRWIEFDRQAKQYLPEQGGLTIHWATGSVKADDLPDGRAIVGNQKADCCLVVVMSPTGRRALLAVKHPVLLAGQVAGNIYTIYYAQSVSGMPGDYTIISAGGPFTTSRIEFFGTASKPAIEPAGRPVMPATEPADQPQLCFMVPRQPKDSPADQQQTITIIRRQFGRVLSNILQLDQAP